MKGRWLASTLEELWPKTIVKIRHQTDGAAGV
jgi:hypothetical protein